MNLHSRLGVAMIVAAVAACDDESRPFSTTLAAKDATGLESGEFAVGEPITFTYVTTNHTDRVQDIVACPWGANELRIYDADGLLVWNVTDTVAFVPIFVPDSYDPGEARTVTIAWHQDYNDGQPNFEPGTLAPVIGEEKVPAGSYYAVVEGCASQDGKELKGFTSPPVDFQIR